MNINTLLNDIETNQPQHLDRFRESIDLIRDALSEDGQPLPLKSVSKLVCRGMPRYTLQHTLQGKIELTTSIYYAALHVVSIITQHDKN